jgi:hypothetical protein
MDKYIGKVIYVELPNVKNPRWRWILKKREDGRYIVRVPKVGVLINKLHLKKDTDFNKETILPLKAKPWKYLIKPIKTKKKIYKKYRNNKKTKKTN